MLMFLQILETSRHGWISSYCSMNTAFHRDSLRGWQTWSQTWLHLEWLLHAGSEALEMMQWIVAVWISSRVRLRGFGLVIRKAAFVCPRRQHSWNLKWTVNTDSESLNSIRLSEEDPPPRRPWRASESGGTGRPYYGNSLAAETVTRMCNPENRANDSNRTVTCQSQCHGLGLRVPDDEELGSSSQAMIVRIHSHWPSRSDGSRTGMPLANACISDDWLSRDLHPTLLLLRRLHNFRSRRVRVARDASETLTGPGRLTPTIWSLVRDWQAGFCYAMQTHFKQNLSLAIRRIF